MNSDEILKAGTVVGGKYKVARLIGVGGMGAVYSVSQIGLGRKAAMKVLHPKLCADAALTARFHREASLAASIGHDNICEVTDFGVDETGMPFLVMPLLKGQSFREILKQGPIAHERLLDIMRQVLSALDAAHISGVVHRDLKPDNIFITKLGDRADFVKLLDFGISKVLESEPVAALTQTGTVLGTADYMAPEQARGDKTVDHRLDIYAAGVILYEALTGTRPYTGSTYGEILFKIVTESFPSPRSVNSEIPKPLEMVILKATARNPVDRFVGAKEMSEALDDAMQSPRSPVPPTNAVAPPVTLQAQASVTTGSAFSSVIGAAEYPSPLSPDHSKRRRTASIIGVAAASILLLVGVLIFTRIDTEKPAVIPMRFPPEAGRNSAPAVPTSSRPTTPPVSPPEVMMPAPSPEDLLPAAGVPSPNAVSAPSGPARKKQVAAQPKGISPSPPVPGNKPQPSPSGTETEENKTPPVPPVSPAPPPSAQDFADMNHLKAALREGRITKLQYRDQQTKIRERRAAEYERLKADYRSGAITKREYETRIDEVHRKYEGN